MAASALPKDKPNLRVARQAPDDPTAKIAPLSPGLVANNLVKQFRKRPVLRGVSVSVRRGEVVGLLVDDVKNVVRLAADEIELAQSILGGDLSDYVLGVGRPVGEPIILLDQRRLTE